MGEHGSEAGVQNLEFQMKKGSGEMWGGRYRVTNRLGEGGMGAVWRVYDEQTGRDLVVKRLHTELTQYEHGVKRFQREIRALAKAENPFVVKAHDVIIFPVSSGQGMDLGLVMEYVEGKDLFDTLRDERYFNEKRAAAVAIEICLALATAHAKGIVHRDLKPENIFLDNDGRVKVGDFGITGFTDPALLRPTDFGELDRRPLTAPGTVFGTPEYLSPEAGMGEKVGSRADLYAVGIIMYRMLAGQLPFRGGNKMSLIQRQINETPKPFNELLMPEENKETILEPIVRKLLAKNPDDRYRTANEAARAIAEAMWKKYPELKRGRFTQEPYNFISTEEEAAERAEGKQEKRKAA
ncbi:MAG: serine/threonine protein kinase [Candidatus Magasanikbacteria bacterium]|nr:serine/threonine protein kinase [Candidatus Magasanikbacteria bacterium]